MPNDTSHDKFLTYPTVTPKPSIPTSPPVREILPNLPPEVKNEIYALLPPVFQVCLSLTCKTLYKHHHSKGSVRLNATRAGDKNVEERYYLGDYLDHWAGKKLVYLEPFPACGKVKVTREREILEILNCGWICKCAGDTFITGEEYRKEIEKRERVIYDSTTHDMFGF